MIKNYLSNLMEKYGSWRITNIILSVITGTLLVVVLLNLLLPLKASAITLNVIDNPTISHADLAAKVSKDSHAVDQLINSMRTGLFKSASTVSDNPMADKTIERIRSELKLQCVMDMNGQRVAYIKIKSVGLRKCVVGETVEDMFTVIDINDKRVDLKIIGHNIVLRP